MAASRKPSKSAIVLDASSTAVAPESAASAKSVVGVPAVIEGPPRITRRQIIDRMGEKEFKKGRPYAERGSISMPKRIDMTLKALAQGSMPRPYQVEIRFRPDGVETASCSCPVGRGGYCKHVAAVLILWEVDPEQFTPSISLEASLAKLDKPDLITLIQRMVDREPHLEDLVDRTVPKAEASRVSDPFERFRELAELAVRNSGSMSDDDDAYDDDDDFGRDESSATHELAGLLGDARQSLKAGNVEDASAAFGGIVAGLLETIEECDEGMLYSVEELFGDCLEALGECLGVVPKAETVRREALLNRLFESVDSAIEHGFAAFTTMIPKILNNHATDSERREFVRRIRERSSKGAGEFNRTSYGDLLFDLTAHELEDEQYLDACRALGRASDLIDKLLDLKRVEEAELEAKALSEHFNFFSIVNRFVAKQYFDVAERLVLESRRGEVSERRADDWLRRYYKERNQPAKLSALAERVFRRFPSLRDYQEIREYHKKSATWPKHRASLLEPLDARKYLRLLVEIALDDGDVATAINHVKSNYAKNKYVSSVDCLLILRVAEAAESTAPREAIGLYREEARRAIDGRTRGSYITACEHLRKVRDLLLRLGDADVWSKELTALKSAYKPLRALQEELRNAGLSEA